MDAVTATELDVPITVGVPEISPELEMLNPDGNPVALNVGVGLPVAEIC